MDETERNLLMTRAELSSLSETGNICYHHKSVFINKYEFLQKTCCNPFIIHKQPVKQGLRSISLDQVCKFRDCLKICVKPGWKLCPTCRKKLAEAAEGSTESEEDMDFIPIEEKADNLNVSITSLPGVSPLKPTQVGVRDKATYAKRKWEELKEVTKEKIAECLNLPPEVIAGTSSESIPSSHAQDDVEYLVEALKQKLKTSNRQQQVSLLTLAPRSWTIAKVAHEFNVTEYTVRKARHLQKDHGILPAIPSARGKPLSDDLVLTVKQFYREDDVSRVMPGAKRLCVCERR